MYGYSSDVIGMNGTKWLLRTPTKSQGFISIDGQGYYPEIERSGSIEIFNAIRPTMYIVLSDVSEG